MATSSTVELWREIPGWPKYEVSNWGRVRSYWPWRNFKEVPRLLTPVLERNGHLSVRLSPGSGRRGKTFLIGRLVLMAFDRLPVGEEQACHDPDGNPLNNHLGNLKWKTRSENGGEDVAKQRGWHHNAKVSPPQVRQIRELRAMGWKLKKLAERFHVTEAAICSICRRRVHRYVI